MPEVLTIITLDNFNEYFDKEFDFADGAMSFEVQDDDTIKTKFNFPGPVGAEDAEIILVLTKEQYIELYNSTNLESKAADVKQMLVEMGLIEG